MYSGVPMGGVEEKWRKGPWTTEEDRLLIHHVNLRGEGRWNSVATLTGLKRNGKSCRLRWVNYLRPDLKRGRITPHEETIILDLHAKWGNRWSTIARSLPGRTDNEIKNYWRTHFKKKSKDDLKNKLKTRLLRRQKFQQEQQLQQLFHTQQKEADIKKIVSLLEEDDNEIGYMPEAAIITRQQDHKMNEELQRLIYSRIMVGGCYGSSYYVPETPMNDEDHACLWDGLWNHEDVHGVNNFCLAKPAGLQML